MAGGFKGDISSDQLIPTPINTRVKCAEPWVAQDYLVVAQVCYKESMLYSFVSLSDPQVAVMGNFTGAVGCSIYIFYL